MVSGQLISGLANLDYQSKILTEATTLTTLEQKFNRLVCLETTDKSTTHLPNTMNQSTSIHTQRSEQVQSPQDKKSYSTPQKFKPCNWCGKTTHPNGSMNRKHCPAILLECHFCGLTGHVKKVCRQFAASGKDGKTKASKSESFSFTNSASEGRTTLKTRH